MIRNGRYCRQDGNLTETIRFDYWENAALREVSFVAYQGLTLTKFWFGSLFREEDAFRIEIDKRSCKVNPSGELTNLPLYLTGSSSHLVLHEMIDGEVSSKVFDQYKTGFRDKVRIEFDHEKGVEHVQSIHTTELIRSNYADGLDAEDLSVTTVFKRAGIEVEERESGSVEVPENIKGWNNSELHKAMDDFWDENTNQASWAIWCFMAKKHEDGDKMGLMFDFDKKDAFHRHGTAIFQEEIYDKVDFNMPAKTSDWVKRMKFFITIHELGHSFNLEHSHNHTSSNWIGIENDLEAMSFMSYPSQYSMGPEGLSNYEQFFHTFRYQFTEEEKRFLRHAPEEQVKMGAARWIGSYEFSSEAKSVDGLNLSIEVSHKDKLFEYLEPVLVEYSLTNSSDKPVSMERFLSSEYKEPVLSNEMLSMFVLQDDSGEIRLARPLFKEFVEAAEYTLLPEESLTGSVFITLDGYDWIIKEPGKYEIQAVLHFHEDDLISNKLAIEVSEPEGYKERQLGEEFFIPKIARVMGVDGIRSESEDKTNELLKRISREFAYTRLAIHANIALAMPLRKSFKYMDFKGRQVKELPAKRQEALCYFEKAFANIEMAEATLGKSDFQHYFDEYDMLKKDSASVEEK